MLIVFKESYVNMEVVNTFIYVVVICSSDFKFWLHRSEKKRYSRALIWVICLVYEQAIWLFNELKEHVKYEAHQNVLTAAQVYWSDTN